jgi:hypothetical protein
MWGEHQRHGQVKLQGKVENCTLHTLPLQGLGQP